MKDLSREELLEMLDEKIRTTKRFIKAADYKHGVPGWHRDLQWLQQIRKLIQGETKLPEKRGMTIEEIISKYPEQAKKLMVHRKVGRKTLEKYVGILWRLDEEPLKYKGEARLILEVMLKELGFKVEEIKK